MKKTAAILVSLMLVLCLFCSCGNSTDEKDESETGEVLTYNDYQYTETGTLQAIIVGYTATSTADTLDIPDTVNGLSVIKIASGAFADCQTLAYVNFPNSLTEIEDGAFKGSSIKNAMMTSCRQLTSIGKEAFADCTALVQVDIPSSVETIGESCFANDTALMVLTLRGDPALDTGMFTGAKTFTLWAYEDATGAAAFAKDNGYEFKTLTRG